MKMTRRFFDTSGLSQNQQRMYWTSIFLIRLIALSVPLYFIISFGDLYFLQIAVASQANYLLGALGMPAMQEGFALYIASGEPFMFFISEDSTGWKSMLFYSALVLAVPASKWNSIGHKKKLAALAIGLPVIWIGNLMRVLGIVLVQQGYGFSAGMIFHDYFYRIGLVVLVVGLWFIWLKMNLTVKHEE
jgi:exosortase/archaeosortase family protein